MYFGCSLVAPTENRSVSPSAASSLEGSLRLPIRQGLLAFPAPAAFPFLMTRNSGFIDQSAHPVVYTGSGFTVAGQQRIFTAFPFPELIYAYHNGQENGSTFMPFCNIFLRKRYFFIDPDSCKYQQIQTADYPNYLYFLEAINLKIESKNRDAPFILFQTTKLKSLFHFYKINLEPVSLVK